MAIRLPALVVWASAGAAILLAIGSAGLVAFHPSAGPLPGGWVPPGLLLLGSLTYTGVGALVALRQPANRMGWLILGTGLTAAISLFANVYAAVALVLAPGSLPLGIWAAWTFGWLIWVVLMELPMALLLFPDGQPPSPRWWMVGGVLLSVGTLLCLLTMLRPGELAIGPESPPLGPNPVGITLLAAPAERFFGPVNGVYLLAVLASVAAPIWRQRKSRGDDRQQLKVLVYAAGWIIAFLILGVLLPVQHVALLGDIFWALMFFGLAVGVPLAIAIAILRYRLYDIDVVINKTLVFAGLALFVTASYVLVVVGVGGLIGAATQSNLLLSVLATAAVAIAFQPVRARAQALADRLVYGRRANPNSVLSEISRMVAGTSSTEQVLTQMLELVVAATGATGCAIYVDVGGQRQLAARWPAGTGDVAGYVIAITHHGQRSGELVIAGSEPATPPEQMLLTDIAAQAGILVRNLRLTAELEARVAELAESRRRIVTAQDAERRRLERDIHDGLQQHVIALMAKLRLARNQVNRRSELAASSLDEVQADAGLLLDELRELASGIHPVVLTDGGVVAAIRARADRLPIKVVIQAEAAVRNRRYPEAVEAAGYFVACEALANVLKHGGASRAVVTIEAADHSLTIRVKDDGRGFDPAAVKPSGLRGLEDRVEVLGGRLEVISCSGEGTTITATLPTND